MTKNGPYRNGGPDGAVAGDAEERAWTQIFASALICAAGVASAGGTTLNNANMWEPIARQAGDFADCAMREWRKRWADKDDHG